MEAVKPKRIVSLELVRVFSCICVLICHFNASVCGWNNGLVHTQNLILPSYYFSLYSGDIGVSLFFMLSGASLMLSYKPNNLKSYYKKRLIAIYPMFYIAWFLAFTYDFLRFKGIGGGTHPLWFLCTLSGMDGYFNMHGVARAAAFYKVGEWFLGCILLIYLVFPLIHYCLLKRPVLTFIVSILLATPFINGAEIYGYKINQYSFFVRIPEIILGMFFVKYNMRDKKSILLAIGVSTAFLATLLRHHIPHFFVCVTACMMLFAVLVCIGEKIANEKIQSLVIKAGALTYPVFLIHHWLSDRLVIGFDLANLSHTNIVFMCFLFVIWLIVLSNLLVGIKNRLLSIRTLGHLS